MRNRRSESDAWMIVIALGGLALLVYAFLKWLGGLLGLPVDVTLRVVLVTGTVGAASLASWLWADYDDFWHIRRTGVLLLAAFLTFALWPALDAWNTPSDVPASLLSYSNDVTPMHGDAWWDNGYLTWPVVVAVWGIGLYMQFRDR